MTTAAEARIELEREELERAPVRRLNLFEKIVAITAAVEKLRKDGVNQHHKYKFFSHANVTEAVRDLMVEHKLVTFAGMEGGSCLVVLVNAEEPTQQVKSSFDVPRPNDQPQSTGAIISYAVKIFYQKTFMLQDVETPDVETMSQKNKPAEPADFEKTLQLMKDASSQAELTAVAESLDQGKFSKDQWNKLTQQYKEKLNAVANGNG